MISCEYSLVADNDFQNHAAINLLCSIRKNSIEFLRPVFLFVFNNPVLFPETQKMWRALLMSSVSNEAAVTMINDVLAWSKTSTGEKCLYTNNLVREALEFHSFEKERFDCLQMDICLYMAAITKELIAFNYDPSENFLHT